MTLEQLKEFCLVVQFQNITRAAERLFVSQSTLSRHILELEDSLGVRLILRDSRTFLLTDAGKHLLHEAPTLLQ